MRKLKTFRKFLLLGVDRGNPFTEEHEWMYQLINSYQDIDKDLVYSLFNESSDMIKIRQDFMITILTETQQYYDIKKFKNVHSSIEDIITLWKKDPTGKKETVAWSAARSAAESAAWSATRSAAWSAALSAAESAARSAARSAALSAARSAAWSAARSAARSAAESAAWSAALSAAEKRQQHTIITLIRKHTTYEN